MAEKPATGTPTLTPSASSGVVFNGDVSVEVGDERNRPFLWTPTKTELRGRWSRNNLRSDEMVEALASMPEIPGMRICVFGRARRLMIVDPLKEPANAELQRQVTTIFKEQMRTEARPSETVLIENATTGQIKTWLYWLRRMVDGIPADPTNRRSPGGAQGVVVSGELPTMEKILALNGKVRIEAHNSNPQAIRYLEDRTDLGNTDED